MVNAGDLKGQTILFSTVDCSYRRSLELILGQQKIAYDSSVDFNSVAALKQCVMEGVGIAVLPEVSVAEDISHGRLKVLAWTEGKLEVANLMIWYKDRWLSPSLKAFMEVAKEILTGIYSAGNENVDIPPGTLASILKQAGLK